MVNVRRHLLREKQNLRAAHLTDAPPHTVSVQARESGSFPAFRSSSGNGDRTVSSAENPSSMPVQIGESGKHDDESASKSWEKWIYTVVVPTAALILVVSLVFFIVSRRNAAVISPWKTGLSCQLQKAFITGLRPFDWFT